MDYKIILSEATWEKIISRCVTLQTFAEIFRGATVGNGGIATGEVGRKTANRKRVEYTEPRKVPWLPRAKNILKRPFFIDYEKATTILYPNNLQWPRLDKKDFFENQKVLVAYAQDPTWGKRVKVAIDRRGYYVSDSFWVVLPTPDAEKIHITNEVIAAILNWDVSNAWVIEHMRSPAIPERAINTIPFPKALNETDCILLTEAVIQIEKTFSQNEETPKEAALMIDVILKEAYGLDDITFKRLREIVEWDKKPIDSYDINPDYEKTNWVVSGIVDSIDSRQGTITLWLEGFEELQTVQIVSSIPGWMLRNNAAFYTKIPEKCIEEGYISPSNVDWGIFRPQPYTYLNREELFESLTAIVT